MPDRNTRRGEGRVAALLTDHSARLSFLQRAGWQDGELSPLDFDMSHRRYWRVVRQGESALLMHSPADHEPIEPYIDIAAHLRGLGLSAPRILALDGRDQMVLIEDFGDSTYARALAGGADEEGLYRLAIDVLVALRQAGTDHVPPVPAYGLSALLRELDVFLDWFAPECAGSVDAASRDHFRDTFIDIAGPIAARRDVLVHRDYHIDNLMVLEGREDVARCGLLDFQDAVLGVPAYDLVSLVEDARRDISDTLRDMCIAHYLQALPDSDAEGLKRDMAVLGVQRHLKVLGVFTRYYRLRDNPSKLQHLPRLARLLERGMAHPSLHPFREPLERVAPNIAEIAGRLAQTASASANTRS